MRIINATPPADFPAQVIVAHEEKFAVSHPKDMYWLCVEGDGTDVYVHSTSAKLPERWVLSRRTGRCQVMAARYCSDSGNEI